MVNSHLGTEHVTGGEACGGAAMVKPLVCSGVQPPVCSGVQLSPFAVAVVVAVAKPYPMVGQVSPTGSLRQQLA